VHTAEKLTIVIALALPHWAASLARRSRRQNAENTANPQNATHNFNIPAQP